MRQILPGLVRRRRVPSGRMLSPSVENLVAQLTRLPGIGSRTAQRLAFHLLQTEKEEALALACATASALRAWPAGCRWAATSSTPTRSRSAGRSPAAGRCNGGDDAVRDRSGDRSRLGGTRA